MAKTLQNRRLFELDALRGLAALGVVMFHYTFGYDYGYNLMSTSKFYFKYGYLGVNLFFIISGFVIFMTLEKTKDTKSFVISRFSRLYPAYWAAIIISVVLTTLLAVPAQKGMFSIKQVIVNFTMLQSFVKIKDVDGSYWTLAVELTFYFWMWFIFKIKKLQHIEWFCLAWMMAAVVVTAFNPPLRKYLLVILILNHSPAFMAGILFYLLKKRGRGLLLHILILASLVSELYMLRAYPAVINRDGIFDIYPYLVVAAFYIIFYLFAYGRLNLFSNKVLIFFGSISYSLYLIHENIGNGIIYWLKKLLDKQIFYLPVTVAIVVVLAWLINVYIEKPAMKKIRNYYKKQEENVKEVVRAI